MYTCALILAALSACALADLSLTAYDPSDSTCTGTPIGHHIEFGPSHSYDCVPYQPEKPNAFILAEFMEDPHLDTTVYNIDIFSDIYCGDWIGTFKQNITTIHNDGWTNCYAMDTIATAKWTSARLGDPFWEACGLHCPS